MKIGTVEAILILGGLGVAAYIVYKMFILPKADPVAGDKQIEEYISEIKALEKLDPKDFAKLKAAGLDMDKLINTYETNKHKNSSKAMMGKYMSYF